MTEEENKAIECLKIVVDDINECGAEYYIDKDILSDIKTALNLIEKLKKEIEEYKLLNANIEKANRIIEGKEEYIPKDKIKEKIKELEQQKDLFFEKTIIQGRIDLLKELLEEE